MDPAGVVAGRFEIEELAGSGGMSSVYRAHDRVSGHRVALKMLHGIGKQYADRFAREARVLAELSHPAVVRYIAHGQTSAGELYLALEWLEGEDLAHRLKRGELTLAQSLTLAKRVADALGAAHARGIVHRDVKPANLFLPAGDVAQVKLLDFGIVRLLEATRVGTATGMMLGTPGYIAPEQARGSSLVDARADVFSLGCVMYRCIAGQAPFVGEDLLAVLAKLVLDEVPRVRQLRRTIPVALDELVASMMAKQPEHRPADGSAVLAALERLDGLAPELSAHAAEAPGPLIEHTTVALTNAEQRLMSVVLTAAADVARTTSASGSNQASTSTGSLLPERAPAERLRTALAPFGAEVVALADGSLVATIAAAGEPTDLAAQAARCALAMHAELPEREMVLATGRSQRSGRLPFGEVIDRAAAMLRATGTQVDVRASGSPRGGLGPDSQPSGDAPARVRLDDVTAGLLDSRFSVGGDAHSLFLVKEREPIESVARTLLGKPTPCVGRDRELAMLEAMYDECVSEPVARVVLVTAPAGLGKSRLRHEFLRRIEASDSSVQVWLARGDPLGAGSPFRLLAQAVRRATGLSDGESLAVRRQKLRARVARFFRDGEVSRVSEFLGELCAAPFPDESSVQLRAARQEPMQMGDQMRRAFEDFLEAECSERPVMIVLEDLHWGDLPTVQWVDSALRNLHDKKLMVLALARPDVHELFPHLWEDRGVQEIRLVELTRKAGERLVREVLGDNVPARLSAELVERAAGNAFYLEEMIRAVAEGRGDRLPETVLAMVQARLDRLEPDERRVLRAASVFGQVFWRGGVAELLGGPDQVPKVTEWLEGLAAREVVSRRRDGKFPGEQEYVFRHGLVRDAAYAMLTEDDRALGHRLAAAWLENTGEADAAVLAEHLEHGNEPARAVAWYLKAAEQALEGNDFAAALARARRGVAAGASGVEAGLLALVRAEAHKWMGENVESAAASQEAMRCLPFGGARWLTAAADLATVSTKMGDHGRLGALALELGSLAPFAQRKVSGDAEDGQPRPPPGAYAMACARVAIQLLHAGHLEAADVLLAVAADTLAATAPFDEDPAVAAPMHQARAIRAMFSGDVGAFMAQMQLAAACFERAGDLRSASTQRANVAYAYTELGAYAEAERSLREMLATAERLGLRDLAAGARHNLGIALARQGALEEARGVESLAVKFSVAQKNRRLESGCRNYLAIILLLAGDLQGAESEARAAVEILAVAPPMRAHALGTLSRVLLAQGRAEEALQATHEAMTLMASLSGVEEGESLVHLAHVEALIANGYASAVKGALAVARDRLLARAEKISDPGWRESFLHSVVDNARILELAELWFRDGRS